MNQPESNIAIELVLRMPDGDVTSFKMGTVPVEMKLETKGGVISAQVDILSAFREIGATLRKYAGEIEDIGDKQAASVIDESRK